MADYIPQNDAEFNLWQSNLVEITEANLTAWGIPADGQTSLKAAQSVWAAAFAKASPRSKAKPDGVHGCEIWTKLGGEAPKDSSELTYVATDTRTPYTLVFGGADVGKTAWYWLRWVNTRGQCGPWGSPISAMVAG
jgi:hypothetical protein